MTAELSHDDPVFISKCRKLELDPEQITKHIQRIKNCVENHTDNNIPIIDTCRLENTGITGSYGNSIKDVDTDGIASFIPAAGASSRYYKPFGRLIKSLSTKDQEGIKLSLSELIEQGARQWPLPGTIKKMIDNPNEVITQSDLDLALKELSLPKALQPCVKEGLTFLEMKVLEDQAFSFLEGSFLITSPAMTEGFQKKLNQLSAKEFSLLIQGPKQSTIRITKDLEPLVENNSLSLVPAGHGTLAQLFPEVVKKHPKVHSVLIRNIDNIIGTSRNVVEHTKNLIKTHNYLRNSIAEIRQYIGKDDFSYAEEIAFKTMQNFPISQTHNPTDQEIHDLSIWKEARKKYENLIKLQQITFHLNAEIFQYILKKENSIENTLKKIYMRPVNTMGMVPNTENNVGGSPVFAKAHGLPIKLCIELPHVSMEDREKYLIPPEKATHFNPVFVISEIPNDPDYYNRFEEASWILAKKTYKGQEVYYHESVLYELISDSLLSNCTFVEIPACLFNPHKSIIDSVGKKTSDWHI